MVAGNAASSAAPASKPPNIPQNAIMPRKIIKNGELGLSVKSYEPFFVLLQEQIKSNDGYIGQIETHKSTNAISSAHIILRLPPEKIDNFVGWLREQGVMYSEKITADDVSEQYYDLKARLENARRFENRLQEMLRTNTGKLEDLVLVEEKLNQIREQIEQFEGKIRYFDNLVGMATLTLNISVQESYIAYHAPSFTERAAEVWQQSLASLKEFCQVIGLMVVALIPWFIPLAAIAVLLWYFIKRMRLRYFKKPTL